MTQSRQQPSNPAGTASRRTLGCFLGFCSWAWGIIAIMGGSMEMTHAPLYASLSILFGILLLPPVRRLIGSRIGVRLGRPVAISLAVLIVGIMAVFTRGAQTRKAAEQRKENAFLATHPFVDRDSLRAWNENAADSTIDPGYTLGAFLQRQQELHRKRVSDSMAQEKQRRADSTARGKAWREDSVASAKARRKDSLEQAREAHRAAADQERSTRQLQQQSAPETYNGHQIFTGPRGGKYYINDNGNKTYIH